MIIIGEEAEGEEGGSQLVTYAMVPIEVCFLFITLSKQLDQ